jgi:hypothetical protein
LGDGEWKGGEFGDDVGGPAEIAITQEGFGEVLAAAVG